MRMGWYADGGSKISLVRVSFRADSRQLGGRWAGACACEGRGLQEGLQVAGRQSFAGPREGFDRHG